MEGGGTSPDDSPGVPGTHREVLGSLPPHTPCRARRPVQHGPGWRRTSGSACLPALFRRSPGTGTRGERGPRRGGGRGGAPRVRARGRGSRRHTKKAAGRQGGAGRGRGAAGRGGGRAGRGKAPPLWPAARAVGLPGCAAGCGKRRCLSPRRSSSSDFPAPPVPGSGSGRAAPHPAAATWGSQARGGEYRGCAPAASPRRPRVGGGAAGAARRAGDGPEAPRAAGSAPRPCARPGGCGASGGPRAPASGGRNFLSLPTRLPRPRRRAGPGPAGAGVGPGLGAEGPRVRWGVQVCPRPGVLEPPWLLPVCP